MFNLGFVFTEQWFGLVVKRCRPLTRRYVLSRKTTRSCRICVFIHWKSACLNLFNSKSGVLL
ncbi:hypothetical protein CFSAN001595_0224375 [Vibrio parahaemolyticus CFSAN001595]|nr:hypothetical protein CFSAN001595_0224375 [Vibrio parahaemolyticus CFSAN001595]